MAAINSKRILIAGGGIGGLATATGLAEKGFESLVLEKAPKFGEIGAGIQLGPNAFHAFDYLGVGDTARRMAVYIDSLRLMDALSGNEITRIRLDGEFRRRFRNPYAVVHRGDLHGVFLQACIDSELVELRTDSTVKSYKQDDCGVTVTLENNDQIDGAAPYWRRWALVECSRPTGWRRRAAGFGPYHLSFRHSDRRYAGGFTMECSDALAGPRCHIVHYPLSDWKAFNLVVTYHNNAPEPVAGKPVSHDEVRKGFEHVNPVARQIIERGQNWKLWVLCDREPTSSWVDGCVTLLGDAAHPMLQYFAQGACMALEDAVCLADEMERQDGDFVKALPNYCDRRCLRTAKVQLMSRLIGEHIYHPSNAHARLRDRVMGAKSESDWCDTISWLYGSTGLDGAV